MFWYNFQVPISLTTMWRVASSTCLFIKRSRYKIVRYIVFKIWPFNTFDYLLRLLKTIWNLQQMSVHFEVLWSFAVIYDEILLKNGGTKSKRFLSTFVTWSVVQFNLSIRHFRSSHLRCSLKKRCSYKFYTIHRNTHVSESLC